MSIIFTALPSAPVRLLQAGGADAYGLVPERSVAEGKGYPCRHCLKQVPKGGGVLTLAYRPFPSVQPYAETGPIFLCAAGCRRGGGADLPAILTAPDYILRGYSAEDRIVYGSGGVVETRLIPDRARQLFEDPRIAYLHVRSSRNNCYQLRIDRADPAGG